MKVIASTYKRITIHYIVQYLYRKNVCYNFSIAGLCQDADFAFRKIESPFVQFPCAAVDL